MAKPFVDADRHAHGSAECPYLLIAPTCVLHLLITGFGLFAVMLLICLSPMRSKSATANQSEYIWIEAENMRGFSTGKLGDPLLNPSYLNLPKAEVPGWAMNGPGVSAEWSQGGESEWNSAAAAADESEAQIYQDIVIPRAGKYVLWVRYADWANKTESFTVRIQTSDNTLFSHEFGDRDMIDEHDEVSMYWGWAFTWDSAPLTLAKGGARLVIEINRTAEARRHVDCILLTNDLNHTPAGRRKPDFAAMRYLRNWQNQRTTLAPLINNYATASWSQPRVAGRDFVMPWNIAKEFWSLYDKPPPERPLYPFNAEPIEEFAQKYKGVREVPIFQSQLVVPVVYLNDVPAYLKEGSPFLRYLRETKLPFAILINYATAQMSEADGQAVWQLLTGELKQQFLGWISGESVGFVWDAAPTELKISPAMSRRELLEAHRVFYSNALARKWRQLFHTETGPMWDKLIPAQSTSSTSFAHALTDWGVQLLGIETAAVQPMTAMRIAFTRGASRESGGAFLYYHAPNFGDTATTFTKVQNFAGPDFFFHSRYGASMGPSLSWYRKSYYLYYMSGASAIYLEQGFDQFFKPGPGDHPFQLNPLGRITDEFVRFAERHPDRGVPYTPIAFLLDSAHGWDMTDYPQWPFEVSQIGRSDRALRELFGVAYYPGSVLEGEPATSDRQAFVSGIFGDIFDVLTVSEPASRAEEESKRRSRLLDHYGAIVVGGRIDWSPGWIERLQRYVENGGTLLINTAQVRGIPESLYGAHLTGESIEADSARCLTGGEPSPDLTGQVFRYDRLTLTKAQSMIAAPNGDPLVTINKVGKGQVIFCALPDLLGEDERATPFAAHLLTHLFAPATPVRVSGDVEYLINRAVTGWVVTLLNNNGVTKPQQGLAQVDRSAVVNVTISLSNKGIESATELTSDKPLTIERRAGRSDSLTTQIKPGGLAIIRLVSAK
ncbi:MAG: hypothetical protein ABR555_07600 [Pyrinomonadaceae bacterium]